LKVFLSLKTFFGEVYLGSNFKEFEKSWKGKDKSVGDHIKELFVKEKPLRYRLAMAHYKLNSMTRRLEVYLDRLKARDKELFEKVVDALISKDQTRAVMYANEVAELRKVAKSLFLVQVALEQIGLRIESIREIGEIAAYLGPVVGVVKDVREAIKNTLPEIGIELGEIQDILQETVMEAGEMIGVGGVSMYATPDARKILEEAKVVAEQRMKEAFPALPSIPTAISEQAKSTTESS
ncbi:MAG: Snf7 family protein, partial [Zestosphaera sp.]